MIDNATLISDSINELNAQREREARSKITSIIMTIANTQKEITRLQAQLVVLRTDLKSVTIEPVTAVDILGKE
jgi:uncharacterized coiled-coil protein SlyX